MDILFLIIFSCMRPELIKKIGRILVYLSLLTPLIVLPAYFTFPFIVPKALFFQTVMVLTGMVLVLAGWSEVEKWQWKNIFKQPLTLALGAYLAVLILATIFSYDWRFSLWNNQERMLGVFTIVHYFILFNASGYFFPEAKDWKRLLGILSGVGVVAVGVGLTQKLSPDFLYNRGAGQVVSTLGNSIYLAGFGLYLFCVNSYFFRKQVGVGKWLAASAAIFGLIGIFIAGTRGTFLGLLGGLATVGLIYLILGRGEKKTKQIALGLIAGLLILGAGSFAFRQTVFVKSLPIIGRVANLSLEGTARTRLMAWQAGLKGFAERPLLGWGPNNYYYVFNKFYNPEFLKYGFQETWFDSAHNFFINILATEGILGLMAYLTLIGAGFYELGRVYKKDNQSLDLLAWGSAFLVGRSIHDFFAFADLTSYLCLFLFLAWVQVNFKNAPGPVVPARSVGWGKVALISVAGLIIIALTDANTALANHNGYTARGLLVYGHNVPQALTAYGAAKNWRGQYTDDISWDFASDVLTVLPDLYGSSTSTARKLYDVAYDDFSVYINRHPNDVRARLVYSDLMRGGYLLFDLPLKDKIAEQYKIGRELSVGRQQIDYSELTFLAGTGDIDLAIERIKPLVEKYPYAAEGYYNLARFYYFKRDYLAVIPVFDLAVNRGVRFNDPAHLEFVAKVYEREGRFKDALYWWSELYRFTGADSVKHKRDELSNLTQLPVPKTLKEFFKFATSSTQ